MGPNRRLMALLKLKGPILDSTWTRLESSSTSQSCLRHIRGIHLVRESSTKRCWIQSQCQRPISWTINIKKVLRTRSNLIPGRARLSSLSWMLALWLSNLLRFNRISPKEKCWKTHSLRCSTYVPKKCKHKNNRIWSSRSREPTLLIRTGFALTPPTKAWFWSIQLAGIRLGEYHTISQSNPSIIRQNRNSLLLLLLRSDFRRCKKVRESECKLIEDQ